jgi:two-component system, chemotaxis family, response regulator Rcp1
MLVREALKTVAIRVEHWVVEDGQAALDFLGQCVPNTSRPYPDVLLLDLNLPRKTGYEVLQELKQHPRFNGIPITVFTSTGEPHEVLRCYALGANAFLVKPLGVAEYFALVHAFVAFWGICQVPNTPPWV